MPDTLHPVLTPPLAELRARRSEKWAGVPADVVPATVAEMDFALAPAVAGTLRAAIDRSDLGYVPADVERLTTAFAAFATRRLGWTVDTEQVALVPDVMAGVVAVCASLLPGGGAVAFAAPNYPPYFAELPAAGFGICTVAVGGDGVLDLDALAATLAHGARILLLASPHNPLGRVIPRAELEAVAELCAEHRAWVVADEIHAPLTLPGGEHTSWLEVSDAAREWGVSVTSASKAFNLAALKCALVVTASGRARDALAAMRSSSDHVGLLGVLASEAAFADGDGWLDGLLGLLAENRTVLEERVRELPGVRWTPPGASYLAWLDLRDAGLGENPAAALLDRGRLAVNPGHDYGTVGRGFVRLNFGTSRELVDEMAERLRATLAAAAASAPGG